MTKGLVLIPLLFNIIINKLIKIVKRVDIDWIKIWLLSFLNTNPTVKLTTKMAYKDLCLNSIPFVDFKHENFKKENQSYDDCSRIWYAVK